MPSESSLAYSESVVSVPQGSVITAVSDVIPEDSISNVGSWLTEDVYYELDPSTGQRRRVRERRYVPPKPSCPAPKQ